MTLHLQCLYGTKIHLFDVNMYSYKCLYVYMCTVYTDEKL